MLIQNISLYPLAINFLISDDNILIGVLFGFVIIVTSFGISFFDISVVPSESLVIISFTPGSIIINEPSLSTKINFVGELPLLVTFSSEYP